MFFLKEKVGKKTFIMNGIIMSKFLKVLMLTGGVFIMKFQKTIVKKNLGFGWS